MQQQQQQISLDLFERFKCDNKMMLGDPCGNEVFQELKTVRTYQGILSGGQKIVAEMTVFKCIVCGKIHNLNEKK